MENLMLATDDAVAPALGRPQVEGVDLLARGAACLAGVRRVEKASRLGRNRFM